MQADWSFDARDEAAANALRGLLPRGIFDAHAHLWQKNILTVATGSIFATGPAEADPAIWRSHLDRLFGAGQASAEDLVQGALFVPVPNVPRERIPEVNAWVLAQAAATPGCRALALVAPGMDEADLAPFLGKPGFAGFKPYHSFAPGPQTFDAEPGEFIPEWTWKLAQEAGLVILLHLVRDGAMADPANQRYLLEHCGRYPDAKVILAHCGRAFHAPNASRGVVGLRGLPNLWFDTAAICESEPIQAILEAFGPRRLLWGSDFPVSEIRGRCVTAGEGFVWIEAAAGDKAQPACHLAPVGLESLRALLSAAESFGLDAADLRDIFCDNAKRLLGILVESTDRTQELYRHARSRIPGGTQLLSKRPEMMAPDQWPAYFREARGCETWDLDGRHYFDFSTNGIGSCLLGFRDPDVTKAVKRRIDLGSMCTLNAPEEVELADLLCEIHPWADQVRFARSGGEVCAAAVRIARATTDRSLVAICGYSGWQDWYLAANLGLDDSLRGHLLPGLDPLGVPRELRGTALTFAANDREAFMRILEGYGDRLAAVIMEPCRSQDPAPGFLEFVRDKAHSVGALLILDEITIGWRLHFAGAHLKFGVAPDIAVYAKALGNGHPMAAIIGTTEAMAGAHGSFISSTYWTESVGPVAALVTIRKMRTIDVPAHVARVGSRVMHLWQESGRRHGLPIHTDGYPCLAHFGFDHPQSEVLRTLFTQLMLDRGFLAGTGLYPTLAHTEAIVERYGEAVDAVFARIAQALADGGDPGRHLRGPVAHSGFHRLTR